MSEPPVTSKFTVALDIESDDIFTRLTNRIGERTGRLRSYRGQRHPSRADVLRAMLVVVATNPHVEQAVLEQVRADALRHPGYGSEIAAVAEELARIAPHLEVADSQDWIANHIIPELRGLAATVDDQPIQTAAFLFAQANSIARHGASAGGYAYLRPMLALAERLQQVRDAVDPREKVTCPSCAQLVRTTGEPGSPAPLLEAHTAQGGEVCSGVGARQER